MNKEQLIGAIGDWWAYNQTMAEVPMAQYFTEQVIRESKHGKGFECIRAKDVSEGIAIRLESPTDFIDGILERNGEWIEKAGFGDEVSIKRTANPND